MCTLALAFQVLPELPILLGANRDEALSRPASGPAFREAEIPFIAPRDELAGGTWLGLNARGLFVGITNRYGRPPDPSRRSRGKLVLDALGFGSAEALHRFMGGLDPRQYNPFHLLYVDPAFAGATWLDGDALRQESLGPGLHVVTERSFAAVPTVEREARLRQAWTAADLRAPSELEKLGAAFTLHDPVTRIGGTCVHAESLGYGTRSSLLLALPGDPRAGRLLWAEGHPCENPYVDRSELLGKLFLNREN